jgi:hypothetical protein
MPRLKGSRSKSTPAYCLHKSSGRAYVTLEGKPYETSRFWITKGIYPNEPVKCRSPVLPFARQVTRSQEPNRHGSDDLLLFFGRHSGGRALIGDPRWTQKVHAGDFAALYGFNPATLAQLE